MKKKFLSESKKIIFIAFVLFIITLSIISSTSNLLKDDAEQTHKNIANIYNKTLSEHLNNSIYNIELFIDGLKILYLKNTDESKVQKYLLHYIKENPYIRSINIIDDNTIIKSTNESNLNLKISVDEYEPKPLFQKDILRFGNSYNGRDFNDAKIINNSNEYTSSLGFFLPVSKSIVIKNKELTILIAINIEEFFNKYGEELEKKSAFMEILNLNAQILISNDKNMKISQKILDEDIIKILKEENRYLGIKKLNFSNKNIISIENIKNYPLSLLVRFDYDTALKNWEEDRLNFLFIITVLLIFIIMLILFYIIKNANNKQKEIEFHKLQIKNQKRFELLFEESNLFFFILNEDGKINKINNTAKTFLKKDILNLYIWDLYCFEDKDKSWLKKTINNYIEYKKIGKEISIINLDLEKKELELTINSIIIDNKKELVIFGKDITEKKLNEKELRQAYQVFKHTHDGIVITDENVNIITVNNAFIKTTGYEAEEVINKNPKILKSHNYSKNFYEDMWKELKTNHYWDGEIVNKKKDDTFYTQWLTITAVYNKKKELINYIGIFSDITKQKQQEDLIKEKERMLFNQSKMASMGEMLGNIAHQWRQPLSVISVAAGAIKLNLEYKNIYKDEEIIEFTESIKNSTNYLSETIDDFRNFFAQDIKDQKVDCYLTVEKTLKLLSSNFKYKEIQIIFKRIESNNILASENEFKQILMNILNNAKDALLSKTNSEEKYIFIDIYNDKKDIYLEILDNAGGIDENIIEKVFEPYFTTKHKSIGTGIGLYMAEEIIRKHMQGELIVANKEYNYKNTKYKGASFTIKIPLYEEQENKIKK